MIIVIMEFAAACARTVDWPSAFESYDWNGGWREGLAARRRLADLLVAARGREQLVEAVDEITKWGHVPLLRGASLDNTLRSLDRLASIGRSTSDQIDVYGGRIASVSKVYAMSDRTRWTIYDSRVAWTLEWMRANVVAADTPSAFPQPPARGAPAFPGAPSIHTESQGRAGFVRASDLARLIAINIPQSCPDPRGWTVAHVEMALFTIGGKANREADWMAKDTSRGGKALRSPAGTAANLVGKVAPTDTVRHVAEQHVMTWVEQFRAKQHATNYAYQTDSLAAHVQFTDGGQRWVVFHDEEPIASFPGYLGDLDDALRFHNYDRLKMRSPPELEKELDAERDSRRSKWKFWAKEATPAEQQEVADLLQIGPADL